MEFIGAAAGSTQAEGCARAQFEQLDGLMRERTNEGKRLLAQDSAFTGLDLAIADRMRALQQDNSLLRSFMGAQVKNRSLPKLQGAQSFFVYNSDYLTARINLWFPEDERVGNMDSFRRYLSVGELHNHDFSFYTINLTGPGYTTHFYRDRNFRPDLKIGDRPDLDDLGTYALDRDKVLLVEAFKDYHSQWWPDSFSVTLNLIPRMADKGLAVQYILDETDLTVKTIADNSR